MTSFRHAAAVVTAAAMMGLPFGCSSIPELEFASATDGGPDAFRPDSQPVDGPADAPVDQGAFDAGCQAPNGGTCCGTKICKNCANPADCSKCEALPSCPGTTANACCMALSGPKNVTCGPFAACP